MSADGTWNVTLNSPMGAQAGTLELVSDGNTLTGSMSGPQGSMELENGTVESSVAENCMIEHEWEDDGEYVVNLTVVDDENDVDRTSILVVVNNRPAVVNLGFSDASVRAVSYTHLTLPTNREV